MGTTFGERLAVLQKKFTEAEHRFAGLKLDLLAPWASTAEPMTHKRWKAFLRAKVEGASPDTIWDPFPDGRFLGRFSGNLEGLQEFEEITREAYLLFCEIDPTLHRKTDYRGWLHIIHDIAYYCPTTDVDIEVRLWGYRRVSGAKKPMVFSSGVVRSYPMDFVDLVRLENIKVKVSPGWGYLRWRRSVFGRRKGLSCAAISASPTATAPARAPACGRTGPTSTPASWTTPSSS
jgi:hypothetical protein